LTPSKLGRRIDYARCFSLSNRKRPTVRVIERQRHQNGSSADYHVVGNGTGLVIDRSSAFYVRTNRSDRPGERTRAAERRPFWSLRHYFIRTGAGMLRIGFGGEDALTGAKVDDRGCDDHVCTDLRAVVGLVLPGCGVRLRRRRGLPS